MIDTSTAKNFLREDSVVVIRYTTEHVVDKDQVIENLNAANQLRGDNNNVCLLIIPLEETVMSMDARNHVMDAFSLWPKVAVISHTLAQHILSSYIQKRSEKSIVFKSFGNEKTALEWLKAK